MAGANHEARRGLLKPAKAQDAVMFISGKARGYRRANTVACHIGDDCLACKGNGRTREFGKGCACQSMARQAKRRVTINLNDNRGTCINPPKTYRPIQQ